MSRDKSPVLILLNGPPASGKSTLATLLCHQRPLALNLDIDVIRGQLGAWINQPTESGLAARGLAEAMAAAHLGVGHAVVVPQYLGRADFIEQLEALAQSAAVPFVEVVLRSSRAEAIDAFEARRSSPEDQTHKDANALVAASSSPDPLGDMFDRLEALLESRARAQSVDVVRGDIDKTMTRLLAAIADAGVSW